MTEPNFTDWESLEKGVYNVIVADPPWRFLTYSPKGKEKKSAENHYKTMTIEDINTLPVADLANKDCALFLWATAPMLPQALDVATFWGFSYKSHGVWCKTTRHGKIAFGTGYRIRNSHEPFIIAVRGNPRNTKGERSVLMAGVREHSRKPDEFYAMVERWLPEARRLDMFSREPRNGWDCWGNETEKFAPSTPPAMHKTHS